MDPREATGAAPGATPGDRRRGDRRMGDRRGGERRSATVAALGSVDRLRELLEAERRKVRTLTAKVELLERQRAQLLARERDESPARAAADLEWRVPGQ